MQKAHQSWLPRLCTTKYLEVDTGRILNLAAVVATRHPGAASHCAAADAQVRIAGHERVGHVVEFHAQLELHPLADPEVFRQRRVKLPAARTAQTVVIEWIAARSVSRQDAEHRRVKVMSVWNALGRVAAYLRRIG